MLAHLSELLTGPEQLVAFSQFADDLIRGMPTVLVRCHVVVDSSLPAAGQQIPTTTGPLRRAYLNRAALDWRDEHNDLNARFFGVEIEVVKSRDSAPTPNACRGTQRLGKRVKAAADAGKQTELAKLYSEFWPQFLDRIATEH
ncbi:hypothetical protein VST63_11020 [Mycolicibacterium sp. 050232]|uniref:hypothetical protein n=1 Tax=Mycolicibacterium sp. 050232 TaxID=3113982 RepID=UPI002E2B1214|nr:hypothetical protein [Mycolicibacterium sp. 050232]MED5812892.1 hypothetical protein [Mycolicibacterium sp. 050232]